MIAISTTFHSPTIVCYYMCDKSSCVYTIVSVQYRASIYNESNWAALCKKVLSWTAASNDLHKPDSMNFWGNPQLILKTLFIQLTEDLSINTFPCNCLLVLAKVHCLKEPLNLVWTKWKDYKELFTSGGEISDTILDVNLVPCSFAWL